MGARSRKRRRTGEPGGAPPAAGPPAEGQARARARGEERNQQIRESLEPLAPGERPVPVTIAAVLAALLALANLVMYFVGYDLPGDEDPGLIGVGIFSGLMVAAATGMWLRRYWAVLGFQMLLAVTILYAGASLAFANNVWALVLSLLIVLGAGWLFWKLIRAMAQLQMPERPGAQRT